MERGQPALIGEWKRDRPLARWRVFAGCSLLALAACADRDAQRSPVPETPSTRAQDTAAGGGARAVERRFTNLVIEGADYERLHIPAQPHTCSGETTLSLELAAGDVRRFEIEIDGPAEIVVEACVDGASAPGSMLSVRVSRGAKKETEEFALTPAWSESRRNIRLSGDVTLFLGAELAPGERVYVSHLTIERRRAVEPPAEAPRVLLISLDAFREDAIGAIGGRTKTPNLDRLLAESKRYAPHWAAEVSTKPSHATILTGLPVEIHGSDRSERPLSASLDTLAERLERVGAKTAAFMSIAPFFSRKFGLDQGFETYLLNRWSTAQEVESASDWVARHADDPFFLFVHLYQAHSDFVELPYESPGLDPATVAERYGAYRPCRNGLCASALLHAANAGDPAISAAEAEILHELYDRGVESLDAGLGRFIERLKERGLWDGMLVVLTADHGEQFGAHGRFLHDSPYEPALRVPLLVKWPRGVEAGSQADRPSTSLDLAPTILAAFGLAADDLPGANLALAVPAGPLFMLSKDAVRLGDLKLLHPQPGAPPELYDLATDPGEERNLLPERQSDAARLAAARLRFLERTLARHARPAEAGKVPYTPEELEQLRSLGYIQ